MSSAVTTAKNSSHGPACAPSALNVVATDDLSLFATAAEEQLKNQVSELGFHSETKKGDSGREGGNEDELVVEVVRPALPLPPERHPITGGLNQVSLEGYGDSSATYTVYTLLDRVYGPPHLAYLVQWHDDDHRFIDTWEWLESVSSISLTDTVKWIDV